MSKDAMTITGMTISLELKRSTYGAEGPVEDRFVSLRADVPTPADGLTLEEALERSLELHLQAWLSLYAAEVGAQRMSAETFNTRRAQVQTRFAKITKFFQEPTHE